ncbi:MAG: hypothetical protein CVT98_04050 [Bacteroidetes bacterium HGW-Bacteroidetes-15]|nr:MAG: hypothetical protein CVT98_04050 [Bacteroidetes bacterium HGW-Bacteroidetes-15]
MNRLNKLAGILFAFAIVPFIISCEGSDFDTPPIKTLDENAILTISDLRALCPSGSTYTFTGDTSLFAVVTMDESTGNIYKQLYVQDADQAVELRLSAASRIFQGDSIRVNLKGSTLMYFNNQFQVDNLLITNLVVQESGHDKDPILITIPQLLATDFSTTLQSKLVKIENVQFLLTELGKTYADAVNQNAASRELQDMQGNKIIVRTSGFSSFANTKVAEGSGSIIAIVTQFGAVRQLVIRRLSEVELNGERF